MSDLKSSLHRFRVGRTDPSSHCSDDLSSAMPPPPAERPKSAASGVVPLAGGAGAPTAAAGGGAAAPPAPAPAPAPPAIHTAAAAAATTTTTHAAQAAQAVPADEEHRQHQHQHQHQHQNRQYGQQHHHQPQPRLSLAAASSKSIPACDRCRSFKKKCSRTFPVCSLCASAGQRCSFSTPASSSNAQTHHLRARVAWLSRYLNEALPVGAGGVEAIETGTDLGDLVAAVAFRPRPHAPPSSALSQTGQSPASAISGRYAQAPMHEDHAMLDRQSIDVSLGDERSPASSTGHCASLPHTNGTSIDTYSEGPRSIASGASASAPRLPADAAARRFVDAYFRNVNRAYPFVNRNKVLSDLEILGDFAKRRRDADSTLLYLIMAIGCTTLQRAGQIPMDTNMKFEVAYSDIIQECLCRESIESIQILVLLALYSLFDPAGASAWSIIGIVSRQAMLLGLSRRASDDKALSATEIELRHRLFWSIYVLDRMMATSLGLPVALTDENMDVPLPGLTIDEFASPERSHFATILQTSRHVIQLRQMEGRILQHIHFRKQSDISSLTHADRRAILQDVRGDIENWYSNGCLVSPLEPDNVPIHNSITWLSARYYFLLLLLYYPSHFNSFGPVISRAELLRFAQKHVQSTSALFQQRQLPLNLVTLCRLFPVGLVLVHSFAACMVECVPFPARDEVAVLTNILEAFPEGWVNAHKGASLFRQFLSLINGISHPGYGPLHFHSDPSSTSYGGSDGNAGPAGGGAPTKDSCQNLIRPIMSGFLAVMQDALGKASCYRFLEIPDERDVGTLGNPVSAAPGPQSATSQQQQHQQQQQQQQHQEQEHRRTASMSMSGPGPAGDDNLMTTGGDTVMNYGPNGWNAFELDFL